MNIIFTSGKFSNIAFRAALSIIFGIVLVVWPEQIVNYLIILIGFIFLLSGTFSFAASLSRGKSERRGIFPFSGLGSLLLGALLVFNPDFFNGFFVIIIGILLVIAGAGQLMTLQLANKYGIFRVGNYIMPMLILICGFFIIFYPFEAQSTIMMLFGICSIVYGLSDLINHYILRKYKKDHNDDDPFNTLFNASNNKNTTNTGDTIEDVDYEEVH